MDEYVLDLRPFNLGESCVRADQGITGNFHLASYLIDEVQIGSVDSVPKLWEDIFTTFPVDSRLIRFEYISRCILTAYTANCDDASEYNSRLSTAHKARVALRGQHYHYCG
jgi:hypothetical protein